MLFEACRWPASFPIVLLYETRRLHQTGRPRAH